MKTIIWIAIILVILGLIALFIWGDHIEPGSIFAGLAAFIASLKSKLFGTTSLKDRIAEIEGSHQVKREDWEKTKQEYDLKYEMLKLKLDSLDNRTDILKQQLQQTSEAGYKPGKRSEEEILEWLRGGMGSGD